MRGRWKSLLAYFVCFGICFAIMTFLTEENNRTSSKKLPNFVKIGSFGGYAEKVSLNALTTTTISGGKRKWRQAMRWNYKLKNSTTSSFRSIERTDKIIVEQPLKGGLWTFNDKKVVKNYAEQQDRRILCEKWMYDPAEMTLRYNKETHVTHDSCPFPYNETIKKIVSSRGKVMFKGCTQQTLKCRESAHYDTERKMRINTPPCCRKHLLQMLNHTTQLLRKHNVTHMLVYGGIIGWYRYKNIVPYDVDLDILVDSKHWKSPTMKIIYVALREKYGYLIKRQRRKKQKIMFSAVNNLNIDLWPYFVKNSSKEADKEGFDAENRTIIWTDEATMKTDLYEDIIPPRLDSFAGFPMFIPKKPVNHLNRQYGKDNWRRELKCSEKNSDGNCLK